MSLSATLGIYVPVSAFALGMKVPVPVVLQKPDPVETATVKIIGLPEHTLSFVLISTVGVGVKVIFNESLADIHIPFPVDSIYRITEPAAVSEELG